MRENLVFGGLLLLLFAALIFWPYWQPLERADVHLWVAILIATAGLALLADWLSHRKKK